MYQPAGSMLFLFMTAVAIQNTGSTKTDPADRLTSPLQLHKLQR
jgi:hypothetical protein